LKSGKGALGNACTKPLQGETKNSPKSKESQENAALRRAEDAAPQSGHPCSHPEELGAGDLSSWTTLFGKTRKAATDGASHDIPQPPRREERAGPPGFGAQLRRNPPRAAPTLAPEAAWLPLPKNNKESKRNPK